MSLSELKILAKSLDIDVHNLDSNQLIKKILCHPCINLTRTQVKSLNKQQINNISVKCANQFKPRFVKFITDLQTEPPKLTKAKSQPKLTKAKSPPKLTKVKSPPKKEFPSAATLMSMPLEIFCKIWDNLGYVKLSYIKGLMNLNNKQFTDKIIYCTRNLNIDINDVNILSKFTKVINILFSKQGTLSLDYCLEHWKNIHNMCFDLNGRILPLLPKKYKNPTNLACDLLCALNSDSQIVIKNGDTESGNSFTIEKVQNFFYIKYETDEDENFEEEYKVGNITITNDYDKKYTASSMKQLITMINKKSKIFSVEYENGHGTSYTLYYTGAFYARTDSYQWVKNGKIMTK